MEYENAAPGKHPIDLRELRCRVFKMLHNHVSRGEVEHTVRKRQSADIPDHPRADVLMFSQRAQVRINANHSPAAANQSYFPLVPPGTKNVVSTTQVQPGDFRVHVRLENFLIDTLAVL